MDKDHSYRPIIFKGQGRIFENAMGKVARQASGQKANLIQLIDNDLDAFQPGYQAYLFKTADITAALEKHLRSHRISFLTSVAACETIENGDVLEVRKNSQRVKVIYQARAEDNTLVITNRCNSNCMMCPDSEYLRSQTCPTNLTGLLQLIDFFADSTPNVTITGGEPTIDSKVLLKVLEKLRSTVPNAACSLLTNGRMFCYADFSRELQQMAPEKTISSIPLHAHSPELHDKISQVYGSFVQTMTGLNNIQGLGMAAEIRVVIHRLNYKYLVNIAKMVHENFPKVKRVIFITLEMLGSALKNRQLVWVDYDEIRPFVVSAATYLLSCKIPVLLYNFPLCSLPDAFSSLAVKSISKHKVRYARECANCLRVDNCGGFFASTLISTSPNVRPIT